MFNSPHRCLSMRVPSDTNDPSSTAPVRPRRTSFTLRRLFIWLTGLGIVLAVISYPIHSAWKAYHQLTTSLRPYHLSFAIHNYIDEHQHLPPAVVFDEAGQPMHSWRVLLTPYLDEATWYSQYDLTQPWNSPRNDAHCRSSDIALRLFASTDAHNLNRHCTNFVVVRGPGTLFPDDEAMQWSELRDKALNVVMLVEIPPSTILWHEPKDLDIRKMSFQINDGSQPCLGNARGTGAWVAFADGRTEWLPNSTPPTDLRAMLTLDSED